MLPVSWGMTVWTSPLKCLWQIFFYFLVTFYIRFWCEKRKNFPCSNFPSPHFSRLKTWNFTSGWVNNRVKRETGDSCVVTCHPEHIDNQNEREVRDWGGGDTRQQPGNFSLFLRHSSLSVNNEMSSYQATVELDYKSGEQRFWLIGDGKGDLSSMILKVRFSRNQMHSTQN